MRTLFMGSPQVAVPALEQLIKNKYNVVAVYTQPDRPAGRGRGLTVSPVKKAALELGLTVVQPDSLKRPEIIAQMAAFKPDITVVCAYGQILTQAVLDIPPKQCVNVHYSLLPRHRGASPVAAAILAGDEYSGVSIQLVRMKLDTGPLLASAATPIFPADTTETLSSKLSIIGAHLMIEALIGWVRGEITPQEQNESLATYFGQIKKEEGEIDWSQPAQEIWRRIRAFQPWPGCFTFWRGKQLKIKEARVVTAETGTDYGRVITLPEDTGGVGIITGSGILKVITLQYEGKRAMTAAEFIRGQRDFIDTKLPS